MNAKAGEYQELRGLDVTNLCALPLVRCKTIDTYTFFTTSSESQESYLQTGMLPFKHCPERRCPQLSLQAIFMPWFHSGQLSRLRTVRSTSRGSSCCMFQEGFAFWQYHPVRSRQSAVGSRQSAVGSRQSAVGSRQSAVGSPVQVEMELVA